MTGIVYIRQKNYPYTIYSKYPHPKFVLYKSANSISESLELDPEFVQVDLANQAELVFDFTDMVKNTFDTDKDIRADQVR